MEKLHTVWETGDLFGNLSYINNHVRAICPDYKENRLIVSILYLLTYNKINGLYSGISLACILLTKKT